MMDLTYRNCRKCGQMFEPEYDKQYLCGSCEDQNAKEY